MDEESEEDRSSDGEAAEQGGGLDDGLYEAPFLEVKRRIRGKRAKGQTGAAAEGGEHEAKRGRVEEEQAEAPQEMGMEELKQTDLYKYFQR
eukprot:4542823-Lingulodinium_polyedra.AAC.1